MTSRTASNDVVIGIDPGTIRCGIGIVTRQGNKFVHIAHTVARAKEGEPLATRLRVIGDEIESFVKLHRPTAMAIEQAFFYRDPRAALLLGHARGVAMLLAARSGIEVFEYAPTVIKRAVVGTGKADKMQVSGMIRAILGLAEAPPLDASDALAVAICHSSASVLHARMPPPSRPSTRSRTTPSEHRDP